MRAVLGVMLAYLLVLWMSGCAAFEAPRNIPEAVGTAAATLTTVAHGVHAAKVAGVISVELAGSLKQKLQVAQDSLNQGVDLYAVGQMVAADNKIAMTQMILQAVIAVLKEHGAENG